MKRVVAGLLALLATGFLGTQWLQIWRTNTRLIDEVLLAWNAESPRPGTTHENGFACAASLLDAGVDLRPLNMALTEQLEVNGPGELGLPAFVVAAGPWAEQLRGCADAKAVRIVPELVPIEVAPQGAKASFAMFSLQKLTRVEMTAAMKSEQAALAAKQCLGTLEVELDRSFLGFRDALGAGMAVETLVPQCVRALRSASAEDRAALAPRFAALRLRLASSSQAYEREWLIGSTLRRYPLMTSAQQARLPPELAPDKPRSWLGSLVDAAGWTGHDRAVRLFLEGADVMGARRKRLAEAVEDAARMGFPLLRYHGERSLAEECDDLDTTRELLDVLAKLAANEDPGTPRLMTRTAEGLEFTNSDRKKVVVPL